MLHWQKIFFFRSEESFFILSSEFFTFPDSAVGMTYRAWTPDHRRCDVALVSQGISYPFLYFYYLYIFYVIERESQTKQHLSMNTSEG